MVGRFLSRDTYENCLSQPQELNRYVYTANNPVSIIDPTGKMGGGYGLVLSFQGALAAGAATLLGTALVYIVVKDLDYEVLNDTAGTLNDSVRRLQVTVAGITIATVTLIANNLQKQICNDNVRKFLHKKVGICKTGKISCYDLKSNKDCPEIGVRLFRGLECLTARINLSRICYNGTANQTHFDEIVGANKSVSSCIAAYGTYCAKTPII